MISELQILNKSAESLINLNVLESPKQLFKLFNALCKLIRHYITNSKTVHYKYLGTFSPFPSPSFIPSPFFLSTFKYQFSSNTFPNHPLTTISNATLSSLSKTDSSSLGALFSEIYSQCLSSLSQGKSIKLDLKIGNLILQKNNFLFQSTERPKIDQHYHASNPNPLNHDNSINLMNASPVKNSYEKFRLPPLVVHSKTNLVITNKYNKKVKIDPYLSAKELADVHRNNFREKNKHEEFARANSEFFEREDREKESKLESMKESCKINQSMIEYKRKLKIDEEKNDREYTYDYFPFTHGDKYEKRQQTINEQLKADLQSHLESSRNKSSSRFSNKITVSEGMPKKFIIVKDNLLNMNLLSKNVLKNNQSLGLH